MDLLGSCATLPTSCKTEGLKVNELRSKLEEMRQAICYNRLPFVNGPFPLKGTIKGTFPWPKGTLECDHKGVHLHLVYFTHSVGR